MGVLQKKECGEMILGGVTKNKKINVLPVYKTPISTYPHTSDMAAILWNNPKMYPWLMNCFIKVYGWHVEGMDYNMDYEDFYILDCPAILYERINRRVLECGWKDIVKFVKEMIDIGYYVYLILDTARITVHDGTYHHDLMIYGYDEEEKVFYAADCFKKGKYLFEKIPFNEFIDAFRYGKNDFENIFEFHDDIILLRENPDFSFGFYPSRVKASLKDYVEGIPGSYTFSRLKLECPEEYGHYVFGKDNYKIIHKHLEYGINYGGVLPHYKQVFHLMYEMKDIMCERIRFMTDKGYIRNGEEHLDNYDKLRKIALLCQNMILKYQIIEDKDILRRMEEKVQFIEKMEIKYMQNMIEDIV